MKFKQLKNQHTLKNKFKNSLVKKQLKQLKNSLNIINHVLNCTKKLKQLKSKNVA